MDELLVLRVAHERGHARTLQCKWAGLHGEPLQSPPTCSIACTAKERALDLVLQQPLGRWRARSTAVGQRDHVQRLAALQSKGVALQGHFASPDTPKEVLAFRRFLTTQIGSSTANCPVEYSPGSHKKNAARLAPRDAWSAASKGDAKECKAASQSASRQHSRHHEAGDSPSRPARRCQTRLLVDL